ncbi:hypothetical protein [Thiorhodococcus minor]|uniref:Aspartate/glutamate/uridylate kinase domain-containing protein n=1 Tax=Thiorhodococcus minor TaxID=57489 RepID=A0A6M0K2Y9_9GAMM|nr:hypothetical protein [Thiorhodococcus minor]NEV63641.1 hypothetical protein [Thiorhodococcus minor]
MWVVKLGGSLAESEILPRWLELLAGRSNVVLVPGGGPFADQVRAAQARWGFDDATAHHLALLAMAQYGRMLCALRPGLAPAATPQEMRCIAGSGLTPVWMPAEMVLADPEVPQSWGMTSDSLAAWLCGRIAADALLLVKSARLGPKSSLDALARDDIVDPLFPVLAARQAVPVHLLSTRDPMGLRRCAQLIAVERDGSC